MNIRDYVARQVLFSTRTFGGGVRAEGILRHIEKEIGEVRAEPSDLEEWCDIIILALDGAWRAGFSPDEIESALESKYYTNVSRKWGPVPADDMPSEHIRL